MEINYTSTLVIKERNKIKIDYNFYFVLLIMLLFVIFRYYNITKLNFILIIVSSLFMFLNPIYGLMLYLFSAAFSAYFIVMPGVTLSRVFGILFFFIIFLEILRRHTKINRQLIFFFLIMLFIQAISGFFSLSPMRLLYQVLLNLLQIGIFIGIVYLSVDNKYLIKCIDITCVFTLFLMSCIAWLGRSNYVFRLSICDDLNPNLFAINLTFLCVIVFNCIFLAKVNYFGRIIRMVVLLFAIWILFLTGVRSSMFGLIVGVIFSLFYQLKLTSNKKSIVVIILVIFVVAIIIFKLGFLNTRESQLIAERYSYGRLFNVENQSRYYIWRGYLSDVVPKFWLFGTGGATSGTFYLSKFDIYAGGHNIIIAILVQFGLVGLIIFGSFFAIIFFKSIKSLKKDSNILPFIAAFIALIMIGIGENIFSQKVFWLSMAMCWRLSIKNKTADMKREVV